MDLAKRRTRNLAGVGAALMLAGTWAVGALAQDAGTPTSRPVESLQAELRPLRPVYHPDAAIRLRFELVNPSEQPVEIPLVYPMASADGVGLPVQLALGSGDQQLVSVIYEAEAAKEVPAPPPSRPPDGAQVLRLAPHAALGLDLDLREYYGSLRYTGTYRVEWRPLDGRLGTLTAEFRVEARKDAILITDHPGKITFVLDYEGAPRNVDNFLELVRDGFYNGKTFHRVIPGYLIQGGCPKGDGTGIRTDGRVIPAELAGTPIDAGTLCMALKGRDPNSASCQFFVALSRLPELDGKYTVIGRAQDDESLRTLRELGETPTDRRDRPLAPLVIRSINLVNAEDARIRNLDGPSLHASADGGSTAASTQPSRR